MKQVHNQEPAEMHPQCVNPEWSKPGLLGNVNLDCNHLQCPTIMREGDREAIMSLLSRHLLLWQGLIQSCLYHLHRPTHSLTHSPSHSSHSRPSWEHFPLYFSRGSLGFADAPCRRLQKSMMKNPSNKAERRSVVVILRLWTWCFGWWFMLDGGIVVCPSSWGRDCNHRGRMDCNWKQDDGTYSHLTLFMAKLWALSYRNDDQTRWTFLHYEDCRTDEDALEEDDISDDSYLCDGIPGYSIVFEDNSWVCVTRATQLVGVVEYSPPTRRNPECTRHAGFPQHGGCHAQALLLSR